MNKKEIEKALKTLGFALGEAADKEVAAYQRGKRPSKQLADHVMGLRLAIQELEEELESLTTAERNPRYLVSRDGNEVGIFPGFNALMAINAARKIYGPGKYSSVKTGEAMFLGRGALQAEERLREETAARAARKAAAKRDKIQAPRKRKNATRFYPGDKEAIISGYTAASQRINNGMNRFIEAVKDQFGFSEEEANRIMRAFIRHKIVKFQNNQFNLTHGAYWEKPVMQRALIDQTKWEKKRKANPLEKSAEHPIEVTRHYRSGGPNYLSPWQRAMAIGQEELFDTGIQMLPRVAERRAALFAARNPGATKRAYESGLKEATAAQLARLVRVGLRVGLTMAEIKKDVDATGRFTAAQIDRAMDQARSAEERLAKKQNPTPDQLLQSGVNIQIFATRNERAREFVEALPNGALKKALLSGLSKTMNALMADVTVFDMPDYMGTIRHILARQIPNKPKWSAARAQLLGFFDDRENNPEPAGLFKKYKQVLSQYPQLVEELKKAYLDFWAIESPNQDNTWRVEPYFKHAVFWQFQKWHKGSRRKGFDEILQNLIKEWYESQERAKELKSYSSKSNPSVKAIYEKFSGRPSRRSRNVAAPAGTPRDLAQLGRLRTIKTVDGRTWRFPGDRAPFLAADSRGRLHIVGGQYRANPAGEDCGEIDLVEYQTSKPHLGHDNETIYYHHMGEETGERPTLEITPAGELVIHGGAYRIEPEGLVN